MQKSKKLISKKKTLTIMRPSNQKRSKMNVNLPAFSQPSASMVPAGLEMAVPRTYQKSLTPTRKGADCRYVGCDFVGTLSSSNAADSVTSYILNSRNATTFPRLGPMSDLFVKHRFNKLRFIGFGTAASSQRGTIVVGSAINDDTGAISVTTLTEIRNLENVGVGRAWSYACHDVPCDEGGMAWYTNYTTTGATNLDAMGVTYVGIPQTTSNADITVDVYVEYDVELAGRAAGSSVGVAPPSTSASASVERVNELVRQVRALQTKSV